MKLATLSIVLVCLFAIGSQAQTAAPTPPPTTAGAVSRVTYFDVLPGKTNDFTTFLRTHTIPILEEQKKQGLIVSYGYFTKPGTEGPGDWDLGLIITYRNYADAVDFNAKETRNSIAVNVRGRESPQYLAPSKSLHFNPVLEYKGFDI